MFVQSEENTVENKNTLREELNIAIKIAKN